MMYRVRSNATSLFSSKPADPSSSDQFYTVKPKDN